MVDAGGAGEDGARCVSAALWPLIICLNSPKGTTDDPIHCGIWVARLKSHLATRNRTMNQNKKVLSVWSGFCVFIAMHKPRKIIKVFNGSMEWGAVAVEYEF